VAGEFGVEAKEIVKSRRGRGSENIPSWVAIYLCRELSQATLKVIVGDFGVTHISGVSRAVDKPKLILDKNAKIKASVKVLYQQLTPIDCYASLQSNYWLHFNPQTFEEYCIRVINFLSQFRKQQIIKYESFTRSPDKVMRKMCKVLQVEFNDSYKELFDQFKVTGDSGRTSEKIAIRPRREISPEFACEIKKSKTFTLLCKKYGFNPAI
jgi:hypothetical protein